MSSSLSLQKFIRVTESYIELYGVKQNLNIVIQNFTELHRLIQSFIEFFTVTESNVELYGVTRVTKPTYYIQAIEVVELIGIDTS